MKKLCYVIIAVSLIFGVFMAAGCGNSDQATLNVYNWGDYIDESVLAEFEQETGIKVNYDTFTTNEDMFIKVKSGGSNYDVVIPSDYMIEKMIKEDMLEKIDLNNIPNYKYIDPAFRKLSYDPNEEYSVPYMWGTVGILYNKTMVNDPVDSWKILWNEKYKKQILMLDSQRDSIGVALKMHGYSLNSRDTQELEVAKEALIEQKPLVLAYVGDDVKDKMIQGEAALAVVWSGDAVFMKWENPDLEYAIPKEGSNLWFDAMVIPKTAAHKKEAEQFINFMCDPEIAFKNTDYIGYSTPHTEAKKQLDPELLQDKTAYPAEEDLKNCEIFYDPGEFLKEYDRVWTEVIAY
ncbi:MAG: ABC transporter substrate-binding protein [Bacillota bacterium]|jgi:spermidine/putrescine transport system substrate-binding protein|nr:spermidine/putrescine ABC transporter substrate-binding protein [Clostridia bacterium]